MISLVHFKIPYIQQVMLFYKIPSIFTVVMWGYFSHSYG